MCCFAFEERVIKISIHLYLSSLMESGPFKFLTPCNIIVCGSSQAGKSTFTLRLLGHPELFDQPISQIYWFHGISAVNLPNDPRIRTIPGLPDQESLQYISQGGNAHRIVVIDDLLIESLANKDVLAKLWTKTSHHCNMTMILLSQSLFEIPRIVRNNSHYIILFKALADRLNVSNLGRQLFPGEQSYFMASFNNATDKNYGYLVINTHPRENNSYLRLCTDLFGVTKVYLPKK